MNETLTCAINLALQPKQSIAFETAATEVLYGGGTYGGKSHLMRVCAIAWCTQIPGLQVYIFRREFPELYKNHMEGPTSFPKLLQTWINSGFAWINYGKNYIEFWNGSKIHLCHCQHEKDMYSFDGPEFHVLIIDELTHFTEKMYRYLRGRVRLGGLNLPEQFRGLFPRILCGTNPGGIGHNWVKAFFIKLLKPFEIRRMAPEEGGMLRQFIPALATDNPVGMANDPEYMANQAGLGDNALVRAKRDGDWDIVSGGAFDDVWSSRVVLPRFKLPRQWRIDRSFDWGSTKPFSVLWFAECDGSEIIINPDPLKPHVKKRFAPRRGSLIVCHEWYGAKSPNVGLQMGARRIAEGIVAREKGLREAEWIGDRVWAGPADNQIDAVNDPDSPTLKKQMEEKGIYWLESDKSPGSRKVGLDLIREMLCESSLDAPEDICLYVMDHCRELISHIPVLPRDDKNYDDVDSDAEDHDYDALRYRILKGKRVTTQTALRI
jgi:hypothetical protein